MIVLCHTARKSSAGTPRFTMSYARCQCRKVFRTGGLRLGLGCLEILCVAGWEAVREIGHEVGGWAGYALDVVGRDLYMWYTRGRWDGGLRRGWREREEVRGSNSFDVLFYFGVG